MSDATLSRSIALGVLNRVLFQGAYPDLALDTAFARNPHLSPRDRRLIHQIVLGVLRWLHRIDYVIDRFVDRKVKNKTVLNILRMGAYQILFLDGVADYAAVNETVNIANLKLGWKISGFVNATLREISREKGSIEYPGVEQNPTRYIEIVNSYPRWLSEKWTNAYGTEYTLSLTETLNRIPHTCGRVNRLRATRDEIIAALEAKEIEAHKAEYSEDGIVFTNGVNPSLLQEHKEGLLSIQDEGAQLCTLLLNPRPGERVLDACSAPGGKTTYLGELMENTGEIVATDINPARLKMVNQQSSRVGLNIVSTAIGDASGEGYETLFSGEFDRVLIDAPCSGLGTIRRNPDVKWTKSPRMLSTLSNMQYRIMDQCSKLVRKGGIMLFVVCTFMPEENEVLCSRFLGNNTNFEIATELEDGAKHLGEFFDDRGYFITDPVRHGTDGFFALRLRRTV